MQYITGTGTFSYEPLGDVKYTVRSSARRVIARWRGNMLQLTLPPGLTTARLDEILRQMQPRLIARRPEDSFYKVGEVMDFGDFSVNIIAIPGYGRRCSTHQTSRNSFEIRIAEEIEIGASETTKAISNAMRAIARFVAPGILLPRAKALADEVKRRPIGWEISSGLRVLGHCNSRGIIAISYFVVFLPAELRDYIIYHELAHLSEMNHSTAFHKICNQYCGGRERQMIAALKSFRFPVV